MKIVLTLWSPLKGLWDPRVPRLYSENCCKGHKDKDAQSLPAVEEDHVLQTYYVLGIVTCHLPNKPMR